MTLMPRNWTLNRLRERLQKLERAKDGAMQAMVERDHDSASRPRYEFQDPGQLGTMLDEIAMIQAQIALLEEAEAAELVGGAAGTQVAYAPSAQPSGNGGQAGDKLGRHVAVDVQPSQAVSPFSAPGFSAPAYVDPPAHASASPTEAVSHGTASQPLDEYESALEPLLLTLRAELSRIQRSSGEAGRIGVNELRQALRVALASEDVLQVAFTGLRREMANMQRSGLASRIGLSALREALRASLTGASLPEMDLAFDGAWPYGENPGVPLAAGQDGWHWVGAAGGRMAPLLWHAESTSWGHRLGITPQRLAADGMLYFGPCPAPSGLEASQEH